MIKKKQTIEILFIIGTFAFSALFILLLFIAKYPEWWKWIVYEQVPLTWLESSLLLGSSFFAFICFLFTFLNKDRNFIWWTLLSAGFFALSFDERFAVHERIRDSFLAPHGVRVPFVSWISPGDFLLLFAMIIGLAMLYKIIKLFKYRKTVLILFISGVILASIAIIMDSIDIHDYSVSFQRVEQFIEEIFETAAMLFFMNSFFLCTLDMIYKEEN